MVAPNRVKIATLQTSYLRSVAAANESDFDHMEEGGALEFW